MAEAFVAHFITNSRRTREINVLLTMKLEDNETVKTTQPGSGRPTTILSDVAKKWQSEHSNWVFPLARACASLLPSAPYLRETDEQDRPIH